MHRVLAVGSVSKDTITHVESGVTHERLGGPATIAAVELHPFIDAAVYGLLGSDERADWIRNKAADIGLSMLWSESLDRSCFYAARTFKGEPFYETFHFPSMKLDQFDIDVLLDAAANSDAVIADTALDVDVLSALIDVNPTVMIIASDAYSLQNIKNLSTRPRAVTMNLKEMHSLGFETPEDFSNAPFFSGSEKLVTMSQHGWSLNGREYPHEIKIPEDSDFVGVGDSAAAGLMLWMLKGGDLEDRINGHVAMRLESNRDIHHIKDCSKSNVEIVFYCKGYGCWSTVSLNDRYCGDCQTYINDYFEEEYDLSCND